ncbi:MAG: hypothetical protein WEA24_14805 [Gemmatimonadota bacterium]
MTVQELDLGGGRLLRLGAVEYTPAGEDEPVRLVYLAPAWRNDPPLPMLGGLSIPAGALSAVRAALERLEAGE